MPFFTAFKAKKSLPENTPETKAAQPFFSLNLGSEASWSSRSYEGLAREGYMQNTVVYRCVRLIADAAASVPLKLFDGKNELTDHPLLQLLTEPNPRQSGAGFMESLVGHLLVAGNAYVQAISDENGVRELYALRPDRVSVVADDTGWPIAYDYRAGNTTERFDMADRGINPILHLSFFHPLDDHYGLSPLEAAAVSLDIHNAACHWNKALLDNAARPSGALIYAPSNGGLLTPDQFERLKNELETSYQGAINAGRPLLLEGGLDWKTMSMTPQEMDFIEAKRMAAREIALALGVPPMLLGLPGDNTYANYKEANVALWRQTVLPLLDKLARALNQWLKPAYGDLRLKHDLNEVPGLSAEREALWGRINGADFLSTDEKRALLGFGKQTEEV